MILVVNKLIERCSPITLCRVIDSLRDATNKGWAMGSERFKAEAEKILGKRVSPKTQGGDRKSQRFKAKEE